VARRRAFGDLFAAKITAIAEELSVLSNEEITARDAFRHKQAKELAGIPLSFLPALSGRPGVAEIGCRPFDSVSNE
jgi:hypothetical protein